MILLVGDIMDRETSLCYRWRSDNDSGHKQMTYQITQYTIIEQCGITHKQRKDNLMLDLLSSDDISQQATGNIREKDPVLRDNGCSGMMETEYLVFPMRCTHACVLAGKCIRCTHFFLKYVLYL